MGINSANYVNALIRAQLNNAEVGTNHDIYDKRLIATYTSDPFEYVPCCVYFYYLAFDANSKPKVDHYFYNNGPVSNPGMWNPIDPADVGAILPGLVENARNAGTNPPVSGSNFQNVVWTRKSYIVILVDEVDWVFQKRINGFTAAAFNITKGSTPNHSFFDARDILVRIPLAGGGEDVRHAIAFINHMKRNSDGEDLEEGERQRYEFDAYVDVDYYGPAVAPLKVILDPGGTNQGPPETP